MGKKRAAWDYSHYCRYLKEGRGQGTGKDYKPWITIHDFPSRGISCRVPGITTGRIHHLLSRNEERYFYLLDADPDVLDIREQFPLRLSETLEIARVMNIRHPWKGSFPNVMTTDFMITRHDGLHARTVKESSELDNPRVVEKFMIERVYWQRKCIDWKIVTEKEISRNRAETSQWLYSGDPVEKIIPDPCIRQAAMETLMKLVDGRGSLCASAVETIEEAYGLQEGSAIALYKKLIRDGRISPDPDSMLFR